MGALAQARRRYLLGRVARSESLGDYCAGPNHVLPTSAPHVFHRRWVCTTSKRSSLIEVSEQGAQTLGTLLRCWRTVRAYKPMRGQRKCGLIARL
jgi:histidinol dehydrogenase